MSFQFYWDTDEKAILRFDFEKSWNWGEFRAAADDVHKLIASVDHPVAVIVDLKDNVLLPSGAFLQFRNAQLGLPVNTTGLILVSTSIFMRGMLSLYSQIDAKMGKQLAIVDSQEQARSLIAEQDHQSRAS